MTNYTPQPTALETAGGQGYLRIATEEAWWPEEVIAVYRGMLERGEGGPGFHSLIGHYLTSQSDRAKFIVSRLADTGELRLADMDAAGVDHAILSLTSPGTNSLDPALGTQIATIANDRLAEACAANPARFSGLATLGFEEPDNAVKELDRAINQLGLKGVVCNSHIRGRYLSDPAFWPILEAIEACDVPIYLHPQTPNDGMISTLLESGLDGAIFGFAIETSMHALKIITSGVLDRFPKLRIVLGHMGEALPFWLYRFDYMHRGQVVSKRYEAIQPLELTPSDYLKRNFWYTSSGMPWGPTIEYVRKVVGPDRVMYAMDYPYEYAPDEVRMQDQLDWTLAEKKAFFEDIPVSVFGLDRSAMTA
ncbi:MAG: amidohydrolase family protein [Propionibacteriaceae bacterium]|nr:amidohydrolase family protein [Propionibacteriaceae bacterium]